MARSDGCQDDPCGCGVRPARSPCMANASGPAGLARAVVARQRQLGLSQQDVAARSGVSAATVRKLQSGGLGNFRPQTLARIAEALDWPPNALLVILDGGGIPGGRVSRLPDRQREVRLATRAARLAPHELRAVERLVDDLLKGPTHRRR